MNRRDTITALFALGAASGSLCNLAQAQQAGRPYRIALLPDFRPSYEPLLRLFAETLRESGRIEGRDFVFYRSGIICTYLPPFHPPEEAELIIQEMRDAGRSLGIEVRILKIAKSEQTAEALAKVVAERMDALLLTSGVSTFPRRQEIMQLALERRLPTITDFHWPGVEPQPLMSYTPPFSGLIRQATAYVTRILWEGAKPGDLPIQLPATIELTVNLKTAKALDLSIPQALLLRANHVID